MIYKVNYLLHLSVSHQRFFLKFVQEARRLPYSGGLLREKTSRIGEKYDFRRENFHRLLAFAMPEDTTPPNFT